MRYALIDYYKGQTKNKNRRRKIDPDLYIWGLRNSVKSLQLWVAHGSLLALWFSRAGVESWFGLGVSRIACAVGASWVTKNVQLDRTIQMHGGTYHNTRLKLMHHMA